jgi:hypothetical protein
MSHRRRPDGRIARPPFPEPTPAPRFHPPLGVKPVPEKAPRFAEIESPLEALLLWAFAAGAKVPRQLAQLLGVVGFDESALSARQQEQLRELRATRLASELFSREELGGLLRSQLGLKLAACDSAQDYERLARAAAKLPTWAFNPKLAALEDAARTIKASEARLQHKLTVADAKARRVEALARANIAKQAIADPRAFSSAQIKSAPGSAGAVEAAYERGLQEGEQNAAAPFDNGECGTFEEELANAKQLIALIEAVNAPYKEPAPLIAGTNMPDSSGYSESARRDQGPQDEPEDEPEEEAEE